MISAIKEIFLNTKKIVVLNFKKFSDHFQMWFFYAKLNTISIFVILIRVWFSFALRCRYTVIKSPSIAQKPDSVQFTERFSASSKDAITLRKSFYNRAAQVYLSCVGGTAELMHVTLANLTHPAELHTLVWTFYPGTVPNHCNPCSNTQNHGGLNGLAGGSDPVK